MKFFYEHHIKHEALAADLQKFVDFLGAHGVDSVSSLEISCFPWRNGERLQAVDSEGKISPVMIELDAGDARYVAPDPKSDREAPKIRERPDELGEFGWGLLFGIDD